MTVRIEVDYFEASGRRAAVLYLDLDSVLEILTPDQLAEANRAADNLLADLRAAGVADPAAFALAELVGLHTDAAAYEREATRRGLLPL